jgi:hypothetical protein
MKLVIRPLEEPHRELDVTHLLVSAIAEELWRLYGGNEELNWLEAELHLGRIVEEAHADASLTDSLLVAVRVPPTTRAEPPAVYPGRLDHTEWPALARTAPLETRAARRNPEVARPSRRIGAGERIQTGGD